ncbi:hypothetical protein H1_0055 [Aeromonas phage vB_AhydM-H1]|nr:hypothetical protein H1_0055 [Aeromonas phage vB_AhydM-H1]
MRYYHAIGERRIDNDACSYCKPVRVYEETHNNVWRRLPRNLRVKLWPRETNPENKGFKPVEHETELSSWDFGTPDGRYARLFWDPRRKSYTIHHK